MNRLVQVASISTFWLLSSTASAYELIRFGPEAFDPDTATMDIGLGVSGFIIEDFEDADFVNGLTINPMGSWFIHQNPYYWDGADGSEDGFVATFAGSVGATLVFDIPGGASSFGIGFSSASLPNTISINGGPAIGLANPPFVLDAIGRNGYVRVDAEPEDAAITSIAVTIHHPDNPTTGEAIRVDHVAFAPSIGLGTLINDLLADPPSVNGHVISLEPGIDMSGPNENANRGRLGAFTNRLIAAQDLASTDLDGACEELASAAKKLTGRNSWFIGDTAWDLLTAIQTIRLIFGCPV
ncbi:MAG: hypothetical protein GWN84_00180 [Gammaproteobacteria bacterium]|nr:hypothetical protein [Gammaproteobacteria bacterium]NIR81622.1 hypothetical protein [Gammaproteobacteria bacterium]NIR88173.1 hypothetical protein [Gammaproteobacteria bacterium]NIU02734.1 hypothetical protein [Gammaproteobacteria bacterium]NIV73333.1 hypothetical protein [Gammaproteobacteria bacterium]